MSFAVGVAADPDLAGHAEAEAVALIVEGHRRGISGESDPVGARPRSRPSRSGSGRRSGSSRRRSSGRRRAGGWRRPRVIAILDQWRNPTLNDTRRGGPGPRQFPCRDDEGAALGVAASPCRVPSSSRFAARVVPARREARSAEKTLPEDAGEHLPSRLQDPEDPPAVAALAATPRVIGDRHLDHAHAATIGLADELG